MKSNYFSLIEIMAAMTIIMILLGIVVGGGAVANNFALRNRTQAQLSSLEVILQQYKTDWGFYPEAEDVLVLESWDEWYYFSLMDPDKKEYIDNSQIGFSEIIDTSPSANFPTPENYMETEGNEAIYYVDPYGQPFYYQCPGVMNPGAFDLWSKGRDIQHGDAEIQPDVPASAQSSAAKDADDITNWGRN